MKGYQQTQKCTESKVISNSIRKSNITLVQPKLTIGQPNDKYEEEADSVADQVMRMPDPVSNIQRQCESCEEEESIQTKPIPASISPWIQTQPTDEENEVPIPNGATFKPSPMIQKQPVEEKEEIQTKPLLQAKPNQQPDIFDGAKLHANECSGCALPDATKKFFEPRFGNDFKSVRVHTCDSAIQMNKQLNAQAFTYGNNIYFNKDKYKPESQDGKRLLAHELTHVVQQKGPSRNKSISPWIQRATTPDGVDLGPSDRSKNFCEKQTLWATTTTQNTPTRAIGVQTIWFKGKNTGANAENVSCSCDCGMYRHWIRGYWRSAAGGAKQYNIQSCGNALTINESTWTEEYTNCIGDNDTGACDWSYADAPGWNSGLSDGSYVELHFEFKYQLWDRCNNRSVAQAKRTLDISGDTHPRTITWTTP